MEPKVPASVGKGPSIESSRHHLHPVHSWQLLFMHMKYLCFAKRPDRMWGLSHSPIQWVP